jgi:hypothetical protein
MVQPSEILQHGGTASIILGTILSVIGLVLAVSPAIFGFTFMPRVVVSQSTDMSEPPSDTPQKDGGNIHEGFLTFLVILGAAAVLALAPIVAVAFLALETLLVISINIQVAKLPKRPASGDSHKSSNSQKNQRVINDKTDSSPPERPAVSMSVSQPSSNLTVVTDLLQDLLLQARMALHDLLIPDGYLLGWNQGGALHPHMHVIPRFDDEPLSDRWLHSAINVPENRRPDPWAPGSGRALRGCQVSRAGSYPIEQATLDSEGPDCTRFPS